MYQINDSPFLINPMKNINRTLVALIVHAVILAYGLAGSFSLSYADQDPPRTMELKLGESKIINTDYPFSRVSIAAPAVADIVILSPREAYVYGKTIGYTSMVLWEEGKGRTVLDVRVVLDLSVLREKFKQVFPDQQIEIQGTESGIVLTGMVSGPEIVEQAIRLAKAYLPNTAASKGALTKSETGKSGSDIGVTNLLQVGSVQQVMLEVKIAEISRGSGKNWQAALGIFDLSDLGSDWNNFHGALGVNSFDNPTLREIQQTGTKPQIPGSLLMNFAGIPANVFLDIDNFNIALHFLEAENLARILAEPRLVTQSGKTASFLAGGEVPFATEDRDGRLIIEYKEFGVGLSFNPVVLSNGKIDLHVAPSVSDISGTNSVTAVNGVITNTFNFAVRKLETNVQLYDGQTLALGGLLQDNIRETVNKLPMLADIPVLGSLFRSSSFINDKTDLLIAVTPHLVKPITQSQLHYPGEDLTPPNRYDFYMMGRLEGAEDTKQAGGAQPGGFEGAFGHQPLTNQ